MFHDDSYVDLWIDSIISISYNIFVGCWFACLLAAEISIHMNVYILHILSFVCIQKPQSKLCGSISR